MIVFNGASLPNVSVVVIFMHFFLDLITQSIVPTHFLVYSPEKHFCILENGFLNHTMGINNPEYLG